jgi:hypothetical protein
MVIKTVTREQSIISLILVQHADAISAANAAAAHFSVCV